MSIVIKPEAMKYRDPTTGDYKGVDIVAERETSEQVADIQSEGATQIQAVQDAADAAMSVIPSQQTLTDLSNDFAPQYSSSSAYSVGDYCIHDYKLYKCNTAIASGGESWTVAHWTLVNTASGITNINTSIGLNTIIINNDWKNYDLHQIGSNGSIYKNDGTTFWGANYYHTSAIPVNKDDVVVIRGYGTSTYRNLYFYTQFTSETSFSLSFSNYCTSNMNEIKYIVPENGFIRLQTAKNFINSSYAYVFQSYARYFEKFHIIDELGMLFEESGYGFTNGNYKLSTIGPNGSIYSSGTTTWGNNFYRTDLYPVNSGDYVVIKAYGTPDYRNIYFYSSFTDENTFNLVDSVTCRSYMDKVVYKIPSDGLVRLQVKSDHLEGTYAYIYTSYLAQLVQDQVDSAKNKEYIQSIKVDLSVSSFNVRDFSDDGQGNGCSSGNVSTYLPQWKNLISSKFNTDFLCMDEWYPYFDRAETILAYDTIFKQFYPYMYELPANNPNKVVMSKYPCTFFNYSGSAFPMPTCVVNIKDKKVAVICWLQSGTATVEQRQANYAAAISAFQDYDAVVFAGDYNTNQGTSELSVFTDAGYTLGNGGYWGEIGTHATTNPDFPDGLPLDNIVSKGLVYEYFEKITEKLTSDHNGVRAKFRLN